MRHNTTQASQGHPTSCWSQGWAALQKNHLAPYKLCTAAVGNVVQQSPACRADVIGQTVLRERYVFGP